MATLEVPSSYITLALVLNSFLSDDCIMGFLSLLLDEKFLLLKSEAEKYDCCSYEP